MKKSILYVFFLKLLQKYADFIYKQLELAIKFDNDMMFEYWLWKGLLLDYWCTDREIYLN